MLKVLSKHLRPWSLSLRTLAPPAAILKGMSLPHVKLPSAQSHDHLCMPCVCCRPCNSCGRWANCTTGTTSSPSPPAQRSRVRDRGQYGRGWAGRRCIKWRHGRKSDQPTIFFAVPHVVVGLLVPNYQLALHPFLCSRYLSIAVVL